jgi:starch phosphorylase
MPVDPSRAVVDKSITEVVYFCSEFCLREYRRTAVAAGIWKRDEAKEGRRVAYFSMEIMVEARMPTYAGGLGVLAGDMLRSCADLRVPIVGVTLLHRKGYFVQSVEPDGQQREEPATWEPREFLDLLPGTAEVCIEGRTVHVQAWKREVIGADGYVVPVLFLDTDIDGNTPNDRHLTDCLYGGDDRYRLAQEVLLGVGGLRMLKRQGYSSVRLFHMNEGHAAFVALELLRLERKLGGWGFGAVQRHCVFTTHTPVPAGHDQFDWGLVREVVGEPLPHEVFSMLGGRERLNMTLLALNLSHFLNGVARKHGEVSEQMFPGRDVHHITNGVHSATWTTAPFRELFDEHALGWREDPSMLRKVASIPAQKVWDAHVRAKKALFDEIKRRTGQELSLDRFTVGFARRATAYKRPSLIFSELDRLRRLGKGRLQLVFAGKAHPRDASGKEAIRGIHEAAKALGADVPVVFLPDYDAALAALLVGGVDIWLNTPKPRLEASGTSGMKAAHNGVPSLSTLDGWWVEGCVEGVTGWSVGSPDGGGTSTDKEDSKSLLEKLERVIHVYFEHREDFTRIMQQTIALNASFFNSHRMVQQYVANAYME